MTYKEYQDQRQAEFNAIPIFYAFGRQQFAEAMQERGLEPTDTDKLYSLGGTGGYYLKTDADQIRAYFNADGTGITTCAGASAIANTMKARPEPTILRKWVTAAKCRMHT